MFLTQWIIVLSAGHTVDGRNIAEATLDQIAETYDPKTYSARINIEHNSYGFKLGSVAAVKVETHDGVKKLFAQLKPTDYLLTLIQAGQKLHTSCEIISDFAKTGKAYLTGLAVTDSPSSLGTTEMHLSIDNGDLNEKSAAFSSDEVIQHQPKKQNLFDKLLSKEDDQMDANTAKLLKEMHEAQGDTVKALTAITSQLESLSVKPAVVAPVVPAVEPAAADPVEALAKQVLELSGTVESVKTALEGMTDQPGRFSAKGEPEATEDENLAL